MAQSLDHYIPSVTCVNCKKTLKLFNKADLWLGDVYYSARNFVIPYAFSCYWKKSELAKLLETIRQGIICNECHKINGLEKYQSHKCNCGY